MTSLMIDDQLHINHINPYTATATFGVSYNGGYKGPLPDNVPFPVEDTNAPIDTGIPWNHYNPLTLNTSGNTYLKTGGTHPATSFMFPARKFQYDDGSTTFAREMITKNVENYIKPSDFHDDDETMRRLVIGASALLVVLLLFQRFLKT